MPKETIRTRADGRTTDGFAVKVGWEAHQSGEVQVGVEHDEFRSLVWALFGPGSSTDPLESAPSTAPLVKIGQAVNEGVARYNAEQGQLPNDYYLGQIVLNALDVVATYSGVWTNLDRKGINDLIRVLRRARDAAFGRDE